MANQAQTASITKDSIEGMEYNSNGSLEITTKDGSVITIENFKEMAANDQDIVLNDGEIIEAAPLYLEMTGSIAATAIERPGANTITEISLEDGMAYDLAFSGDDATITEQNGALMISFDDNGQIVITNFAEAMENGTDVSFTSGGEDYASLEEFFTSVQIAETMEDEMNTELPAETADAAPVELAELAEELAEIEPAAGEGAASGDRGGYGFGSNVLAAPLAPIPAIGPIGPTALTDGLPEFIDELFFIDQPGVSDISQSPPEDPILELGQAEVYEDGSVVAEVFVETNGGPGVETVITISGIPADWGVDANGGEYDAGTGTWTITLPEGTENFSGGPVLSPPAQSDVDLNDLVVTAVNNDTDSGLSSEETEGTLDVIVDAVADKPEVSAEDNAGNEGTPLAVDVSGQLTVDTDGSEAITGYEISGVPEGFEFNQGTDLGGGVWSFTPDQIDGLELTPPDHFFGDVNLTVTVFNSEVPVSDVDFDSTNDTNQASTDFTLTWRPVIEPPTITVNNGIDDVVVLEDNSVEVNVTAELSENASPDEYLEVTIEGIDPEWGFDHTIGTTSVEGDGTITLTIVLQPGESLDTVLTFTPPAQSDIDLTGLVATAVAKDDVAGIESDEATDDFQIIVDADADRPEISAEDNAGEQDVPLDVDVDGALGDDTDGSETITGYEISGVPEGFEFNQGTDLGGGVWSFTPDELDGLEITPPTGFVGSIDLVATVFNTENPVSDQDTGTGAPNNQNSTEFTLTFTADTVPTIDPEVFTVDETAFGPNGDAGDIVVNGEVDADFKADAPGTISANDDFTSDIPLFSDGVPVDVELVGDTYVGSAGGETIFTLQINEDGSYTFTQSGTLDHPVAGNEASGAHNDDLLLSFGIQGEDSDGDVVNATIDVTVLDDGPRASNTVGRVDESGLNIDENGNLVDPLVVVRNPDFDFGADGAGTVRPAAGGFVAKFQVGGQAQTLTSDGSEITVVQSGNGYIGTNEGGETIFTLTIDPSTGQGIYTQYAPIDHPNVDGGGNADVIWLVFRAEVVDNDGDIAPFNYVIDLKDSVPEFNNDGPASDVDVVVVEEADLEDGDITINDSISVDFGADGPGGVTGSDNFTSSIPLFSNGLEVTVSYDNGVYTGSTVNGDVFTLTVNEDGTYTYNQTDTLDHQEGTANDDVLELSFGVEVSDNDGDTANGTITVQVNDDEPVANDDFADFDTNTGIATGNVITGENGGAGAADELSQDTDNLVTQVEFDGNVVDLVGGAAEIDGDFGTLTINEDGSYTYELFETGETVYTYSVDNPGGSDDAGDIQNVSTSLNADTGEFTFTSTIANPPGGTVDGFTLAINGGPNPKGHGGEMALFYFDANGGDPVVTAYNYNGQNTQTSWQDGSAEAGTQAPDFIGSSQTVDSPFGSITVSTDADGNTVFEFTVDATFIQNHVPEYGNPADWTGLDFADSIGIWFHPVTGLDADYAADGTLTNWSISDQSWYDTANKPTEVTETQPPAETKDVFTYTLTDGDGDTDTAELCIEGEDLIDDMPIIARPIDEVVSEVALASGDVIVSDTVDVDFGADGPGTVMVTGEYDLNGLTSQGNPILVSNIGGVLVGQANGEDIFTLDVQPNGDYTFELLGAVDHIADTEKAKISFEVKATDQDGDIATADINIDIMDSVPVAVDDAILYTIGDDVLGNVITGENGNSADTESQDIETLITKVAYNGSEENIVNGSAEIDGEYGTLTINADGSYEYVLFDSSTGTTPTTVGFDPIPSDLGGFQSSIAYNGITVSSDNGADLVYVDRGDGPGIGIAGQGTDKVFRDEALEARFDSDLAAQTVTITVGDIGSNNIDDGIDFRVYTEGSDEVQTFEFDINNATVVDGTIEVVLNAADFGGLITGFDIFSVENSDLGRTSLLLNEIEIDVPGTPRTTADTFEYTIADFDGDTSVATLTIEGNETLIGTASGDVLVGGAGDETFIGGAGNDLIYTGEGSDTVVYEALVDGVDTVKDFEVGADTVDVTGLIGDVDDLQSSIDNFVFVTEEDGNTEVAVDVTGSGDIGNATPLAILEGVTSATAEDLLGTTTNVV